ncbi:hypothetical protein [uncultured Thiodictyon sp.]|uniref:hypothetical protein n=1 Tax=uncultured Thiodictyon sp. TaxID=1846217 RepID=UPI0025ECA22E|nr:hypothetical protein [uncultured Thiodictyon sp.]
MSNQLEVLMFKKIAFAAMLGVSLSGTCLAADFDPLEQEQIGGLRYGQSEAAFKKEIGCKPKRGPDEFAAADGAWHQDWEYPDCGVSLGTVSDKKGGIKTIDTIAVSRPNAMTTKRGIKIGSPKAAVVTAYKANQNRDLSESVDGFAVGSEGGMLVFRFADGRVDSIFLGVGAE